VVHQVFDTFAYGGPYPGEEGGIGAHLVFAVDAQDSAALAIDGRAGAFAPVADLSVFGMEGRAEIDVLAGVALQFGKDSSDRLGIVPDVGSGTGFLQQSVPNSTAARPLGRGGARLIPYGGTPH